VVVRVPRRKEKEIRGRATHKRASTRRHWRGRRPFKLLMARKLTPGDLDAIVAWHSAD
jgi:hypothetical protein